MRGHVEGGSQSWNSGWGLVWWLQEMQDVVMHIEGSSGNKGRTVPWRTANCQWGMHTLVPQEGSGN